MKTFDDMEPTSKSLNAYIYYENSSERLKNYKKKKKNNNGGITLMHISNTEPNKPSHYYGSITCADPDIFLRGGPTENALVLYDTLISGFQWV